METSVKKINFLDYQAQKFEENRFAAMTILLTFQSCLGSVAAMYIMQTENTFFLALAAITTMAANAMFIAQAHAKICLYAFYTSLVVNTILILLNI